ncbi:hypothetical protein TNCV_2943951 [Trichonephila clavipes]|nr:hypothetical protein TNCV_2943951 [Trichonephila clavipes]
MPNVSMLRKQVVAKTDKDRILYGSRKIQFSKLTPIIQLKPLMRSHAPAIPLAPATDFHAQHHQPRSKTKTILKQDRGLRD